MRIVGVDVGASSVKAVVADSSAKGLVIKTVHEFPYSSDPSSDRRVHVLEALRSLATKYEPASYRYVFAVPQVQVAVRYKVFPFRGRQQILKSLAFELEDEIPFSQENSVFEAKVEAFTKNSAQVLALASPQTAIQGVIQLAQDAGIDPELVSMEAAALAGLVEDWKAPPPEVAGRETTEEKTEKTNVTVEAVYHSVPGHVLLHIGHTKTILTVFHQNRMIACRSIACGSQHIIRSIQKKYNLPYPDAEKGLKEKGFVLTNFDKATPEQAVFSETISSALNDLVSEGRRTLLEVSSDFKIKINRIDLTGGGAKLLNLGAFLTQSFEIPANLIQPLRAFAKEGVSLDEATELRMAVAAGLAVEGARISKNPAVNFRKGELSRQSASFKETWATWAHAIKIGAAAVVLFFIYANVRVGLSESLAGAARDSLQKRAQVAGVPKAEQSDSKLRSYITRQNRKVESQKVLVGLTNLNSALDILNKVTSAAPAKGSITLDVRRFHLSYENLTVEGEVASKTEFEQIQSVLSAQASDGKVRAVTPSFSPGAGKVPFAFQLKVDRNAAQKAGG